MNEIKILLESFNKRFEQVEEGICEHAGRSFAIIKSKVEKGKRNKAYNIYGISSYNINLILYQIMYALWEP